MAVSARPGCTEVWWWALSFGTVTSCNLQHPHRVGNAAHAAANLALNKLPLPTSSTVPISLITRSDVVVGAHRQDICLSSAVCAVSHSHFCSTSIMCQNLAIVQTLGLPAKRTISCLYQGDVFVLPLPPLPSLPLSLCRLLGFF